MRALLLSGVLALTACATPAERFIARADRTGLAREEVRGTTFRHVVFTRPGDRRAPAAIHVYLDGDGTPWLTPVTVAADPSARDPLILDLMRQDPAPSLLLGRPCYYLTVPEPACAPWVWTQGRFSEAVVASLAAAAEATLARYPDADVTLIGYSGGGVLAVLLAPRLPRVTRVITLAANLDLTAWTVHHGYSPLTGSLNPAEQPPLATTIRQTHLYGAADRSVPRELSARFLAHQPAAVVRELPDFDHRCCWVDAWPALLHEALAGAP